MDHTGSKSSKKLPSKNQKKPSTLLTPNRTGVFNHICLAAKLRVFPTQKPAPNHQWNGLRPVVSAPNQGPNSQAVPHAAKPPRFPIQKRGNFGRHDFSLFPHPQNPRPFEPPKKLADEPRQEPSPRAPPGSGNHERSFLDRSCDRHGSGPEFPLARKGNSP